MLLAALPQLQALISEREALVAQINASTDEKITPMAPVDCLVKLYRIESYSFLSRTTDGEAAPDAIVPSASLSASTTNLDRPDRSISPVILQGHAMKEPSCPASMFLPGETLSWTADALSQITQEEQNSASAHSAHCSATIPAVEPLRLDVGNTFTRRSSLASFSSLSSATSESFGLVANTIYPFGNYIVPTSVPYTPASLPQMTLLDKMFQTNVPLAATPQYNQATVATGSFNLPQEYDTLFHVATGRHLHEVRLNFDIDTPADLLQQSVPYKVITNSVDVPSHRTTEAAVSTNQQYWSAYATSGSVV